MTHVDGSRLVKSTDFGMTSPASVITASMNPSSVRFTILGQCYSMKNSKSPRKNAPGMLKHPKCRQFEHDFLIQVPRSAKKAMGSWKKLVRCSIVVFYPSRRQDVDVEIIYDLLQKSGVVRNDRYIRLKHVDGTRFDKKNPRVEIEVSEIQ